jgi:SAM-dependent methyltransferase
MHRSMGARAASAATPGSRAEIEAYYAAVAPFYAAEVADRADLGEWVALARRLDPRRVLDLGCGSGRVGAGISRAISGVRVLGVDVQRSLIARDAPIPFVLGDMRRLPFRDGSFDLVVAANDPFSHLLTDEDRVRAVREARRVLAEGGRVVIDGIRLTTGEARLAATELHRRRKMRQDLVIHERWHREAPDRYEICFDYARRKSVTEACARARTWRFGEPALAEAAALADDLAGSPARAEGDRLVITFGR